MSRMPRKKQYVLDRFKEEDPESYFKYRTKYHSSQGLSSDQVEFLDALSKRSVKVVKSFLDRGLDPNFTIPSTKSTPLHNAICIQRLIDSVSEDILKALLFFGADPNAADLNGVSPLQTAILVGNAAAVQLLLQAGADLVFSDHNSALLFACSMTDVQSEMIEALLEHGAQWDCVNKDQQTALHLLCDFDVIYGDYFSQAGRVKGARMLLHKGLPSDTLDRSGRTPLSLALKSLACAVASLIIDSFRNRIIPPELFQLASLLIEAGGLHDFDRHLESILIFVRAVNGYPQSRAPLTLLLLTLRNAIPVSDFNQLNQRLSRISSTSLDLNPQPQDTAVAGDNPAGVDLESSQDDRDPVVEAIKQDVAWSCPPSLLMQSKIRIRNSLGGCLTRNVTELSIPEKMKSFIKSVC